MRYLKKMPVAIVTVLFGLPLLVACNHEPKVSRIETGGPGSEEIYFITQSDGSNSDDADLVGELQLNDGCLQIASDQIEGASPVNIAWPEDFAVGVGGDAIEIRDQNGRIVTRVGERTLLGGSGSDKESERHGDCEGPFWYAGGVLSGDAIPAVYD